MLLFRRSGSLRVLDFPSPGTFHFCESLGQGMFTLLLLPTQAFNNLAVGLGQLRAEPFVSPGLSFPDPQVEAPAGCISCFPSEEVVLLLRTVFQLRLFYHSSLGPSCPGPGAAPQGLTAPPGGSPRNGSRYSSVTGHMLRPQASQEKNLGLLLAPWMSHHPEEQTPGGCRPTALARAGAHQEKSPQPPKKGVIIKHLLCAVLPLNLIFTVFPLQRGHEASTGNGYLTDPLCVCPYVRRHSKSCMNTCSVLCPGI